LFLIAVAGLTTANAQTPTKKSVERLVVAAGVDAIAVTLQGQVEGMMKHLTAQAFPPGSLDGEGAALMESYSSKIGQRYAAEISREKYVRYIPKHTLPFTPKRKSMVRSLFMRVLSDVP
jgi:hypothetical protein